MASGQAEFAPNGEIIGAVGAVQDVHERVQTNRELTMAREAAEAALRAQSVFTATLSHEIRTPLTGVLAAADLLQAAISPDEQERYLQTLKSSAELLSSIINDVLVFAKLDQGGIVVDAEPFDPVELTAQVTAAFQGTAQAKGLALSLASDHGGTLVMGDPTRLQRVLANLLQNALKFTAEGRIDIRVSPGHGDADARWLFEVTDTGLGVPADKLDEIFEPFVQADASTTRSHGGTGLGLAICRMLVRAMGGEITASSTGAGACFSFTVPLPAAAPTDLAEGFEPLDMTVTPSTILLAEDNPTNRYLITAMLERQGHEVTAVENGHAALRAVRERAEGGFDLILMDVQMPVMDGLTATREIRLLPEPAGATPICAITAEDTRQRRAELLAAGMDEVLPKPLKIDQFNRTLRAFRGEGGPSVSANDDNTLDIEPGERSHIFDQARLDSMEAALGLAGRDHLLDILIDDAERLPRMISECLAIGQAAQAGLEAHSLKGAAAVVGAEDLVQAVRAFEDALRRSEPLGEPSARLHRAADAVVTEGRRLRQEANP